MGTFGRSKVPRLPRLLLAAGIGFCLAGEARASNKYLEIPSTEEVQTSRAHYYANLTNAEAFAELARRGISYEPATPPMPGVRAPIRLKGALNGVWIHSSLPEAERATTPFEILDARLALALDDFTALLERHGIVEIVHFTMYRPSGAKTEDPNAPQTRHPGGMAIDVGGLKKRNGQWLAVGPHWPAAVGAQTCGRGARSLKSRAARELVSIVCEASDLRIFHYMLTPHFDPAHADHLHLEIKPEVKWFLVN
jgi:hypothetical protein